MTRQCECGCGEPLKGSRARRFVDNAHRMRARKTRVAAEKRIHSPAADPSAKKPAEEQMNTVIVQHEPSPPPNGTMGRTRAGLEVWIARQELELPESLVAAARSLADEVDREPDASPLWGRYLDALRQLQEPMAVATASNQDMQRLYEKVAIMRADEEWRAMKYREAVERDDPLAESWERLVPIGCAHGQHSWRRRDYWGVVRCAHCATERVES
jgi:hypothetical protein